MRSTVDNPLWEDAALAQPGFRARMPLSPLEAALQALPVNRPCSGIRTDPSRACSKRDAASSGTAADSDSCFVGRGPLSFEAWRPSSSEVRRALKTQPAAINSGASSPGPKGGRAPSMGAAQCRRSASLSPVCWSLSSDCGDENAVQLCSGLTDGSVWRDGMQHTAAVNGSAEVCEQQQQQPSTSLTKSPEAPASPQPLESPLKRLRLSVDFPLHCASPTAAAAGGIRLAEAAAGKDSDLPATAGMQLHGSPRGSHTASIAGGATSDAAPSAIQEVAGTYMQQAARRPAPTAQAEASAGPATAAEAFSDAAGGSSDSEPVSPCNISKGSVPGFGSCCGTPTAVSCGIGTIGKPPDIMRTNQLDLHSEFDAETQCHGPTCHACAAGAQPVEAGSGAAGTAQG